MSQVDLEGFEREMEAQREREPGHARVRSSAETEPKSECTRAWASAATAISRLRETLTASSVVVGNDMRTTRS